MAGNIPLAYAPAKTKTIVCMGDSHTSPDFIGSTSSDFYPAKLQAKLNAAGARVLCRNLGISGTTTGSMLSRFAAMTQIGVPDIASIYGGQNDFGASTGSSTIVASPSPTTTTASVTATQGARFSKGSYVVINGVSVKLTSVATDALVWTPALASVPAAGAVVQTDTLTNLVAMGKSIADSMAAAGKQPRVIIGGQHYFNFSAGGDTHTSPVNTALRDTQIAAAAAIDGYVTGGFTTRCLMVNHWMFMDNLIQTGAVIGGVTYVQGDFKWHVLDVNSHLNKAGLNILAQNYFNAITAEAGWLASIS